MKKIALILLCVCLLSLGSSSVKSVSSQQVVFAWAGPSGGTGGHDFNDPQQFPFRIAEVRVHSGRYIDAIQVVYTQEDRGRCFGQRAGDWHGGTGGSNQSSFRLDCDEYVVRVAGNYGEFVDSLSVETNKGRSMKWGGGGGKGKFSYTIPEGYMLHGFWGRAGQYVDALGIIMRNK